MTASYEVRGNIAVITMNNPPVNGLGFDTRRAIADGLDRATADTTVRAIVITGAGKAFSGGADIREFGSPKTLAEPNLLSLILQLEASAKPVIAAVHSVAMGGGLELALGCHYAKHDHSRCKTGQHQRDAGEAGQQQAPAGDAARGRSQWGVHAPSVTHAL